MHCTSLLRLAAVLIAFGGLVRLAPVATAADDRPGLQSSAMASLDARNQCQRLMHEDADEFTHCARALLEAAPVDSAEQRYRKLGIAYYAWLSTTAAAKNGLPGAEQSAHDFLRLLQPLQLALKVEDAALCTTIPGDCTARVARLKQMERELTRPVP